MAKYIEREALALKVQRYLMPNVDIDGTVSVEEAERYFLKLLEEQPAADVAEVRHGKWLTEILSQYDALAAYLHICTACAYSYKNVVGTGYNYCPNCGAKMDQ